MSTLTVQQAGTYAKQAGFGGLSLVLIVAIAEAESGLTTDAVNSSDPHGGSWGILQINGSHFGDKFGPNGSYTMNQQTAQDPAMAFLFSYELSNYGLNFAEWGSFTNGSYAKFVAPVAVALGQTVPATTTTSADKCQHKGECTIGVPGSCDSGYGCLQVDSATECPISGYDPFATSYCFPDGYSDTHTVTGGASLVDIIKVALNPKFLIGITMILFAIYLAAKPAIDPIVKTAAKAAAL